MAMQGGACSVVKYVYADVLFAVNWVVNYLLLLATGKLTGRDTKALRLLGASLAGSIYAVAALYAPLSVAFSLPARLLVGLLMVAFSYPSQKGLAYVAVAAGFFLCSGLTAGTAYGLLHSRAAMALRSSLLDQRDPVVHWWIVAASLALLSCFPLVARMGGYRPGGALPLLTIELMIQGRSVGLTALVDTGNNLRDPVSGLPVVVVDWDSLRKVMPTETAPFFQSTWDSVPAGLAETAVGRRLRLIPFESLSGKRGVLPGFRPDQIVLLQKNGIRVRRNAIVGVSGDRLSPNGLYQALVHPDLV